MHTGGKRSGNCLGGVSGSTFSSEEGCEGVPVECSETWLQNFINVMFFLSVKTFEFALVEPGRRTVEPVFSESIIPSINLSSANHQMIAFWKLSSDDSFLIKLSSDDSFHHHLDFWTKLDGITNCEELTYRLPPHDRSCVNWSALNTSVNYNHLEKSYHFDDRLAIIWW